MIIRRICYICEKDKIVQNNSNIAVPDSGMNRDKHPQDLSPSEYSFALNATIEMEASLRFRTSLAPFYASDSMAIRLLGIRMI